MAADEMLAPDLAGLADADLPRWVAEVRRSGGPPNREAGAAALREAARNRVAAAPPGPALALVRDLNTHENPRAGLPLRLYRAFRV